MPKHRKKFIDKKNATTYHLVPKAEGASLEFDKDDPGEFSPVVHPDDKAKRIEEQRKYGVYFDDDYDYMQHLKDLTEVHEWAQVPKASGETQKSAYEEEAAAVARSHSPGSGLKNAVDMELDMGTGLAVDWDPDVAAALEDDFNFDQETELEDDFILKANTSGDDDETFDDGFTLAQMMRERLQSKDPNIIRDGNKEETEEQAEDESEDTNETDEDFSGSDDMEFFDPEDFSFEEGKTALPQYSLTSSILPRNEQLQLLDARFEKLYEEYGPESIGALDHEELNGRLTANSDLMKQALEDLEKYKEVTTMRDIVDSVDEDTKSITKQWHGDSEEEYEWKEIPSNKPKWDCESIRSLYSTTSNLPTTVYHDPDRMKKRKKQESVAESGEAEGHLTLQDVMKQNLEDRRADRASTFRPKGETHEERQARKKAVKFEQQERRKEKKANRLAFRAEHVKQQKEMAALHRNVKALSLSTNA